MIFFLNLDVYLLEKKPGNIFQVSMLILRSQNSMEARNKENCHIESPQVMHNERKFWLRE